MFSPKVRIETAGVSSTSARVTNPFIGGGVDLSFMINKYLFVVLNLQNYTEIENGTVTMLNVARLGVNIKF